MDESLNQYFSHCKLIDIHYHADPDLYTRRHDAIAAGERYQALNAAVVLKSHLGSTGVSAMLSQRRGLPVLPSLVLNPIAGGIHYRVILHALAEYQSASGMKLIVHFPTLTGRSYQSKLERKLVYPDLQTQTLTAETLFDEKHRLRKNVIDILKLANDYPIALSTGHASKQEVYALVEACDRYQVQALLLNQPANPLTGLKADELQEIGKYDFVWCEQTALTFLLGHQSEADFKAVLKEVPRVIYSSDLGQTSQMDIAEWISWSQKLFQDYALPKKRQKEIWRNHPLQLLTIK